MEGFCAFPGSPPPATWRGHGALQRVDLDTGLVTTLATECGGNPLRAPNDLVVDADADGSIWFKDHGTRGARTSHRTGFHHCRPDGSGLVEVAARRPQRHRPVARRQQDLRGRDPHRTPLGLERRRPRPSVGLGVAGPQGCRAGGDPGGGVLFDSLAVDGEGWICVATLGTTPGITAFSPDGSE